MPDTIDAPSSIDVDKKLQSALSSKELMGTDLDELGTELTNGERKKEITESTKESLRRAWESLSKLNGPRTPREQKIINLYNSLFSAELIQKSLAQTSKPSGNLNGLIKPDGTVDTDAFKNLSPDQIREKIGKLNKSDIKLVVTSLENVDNGILKQTIMQVVTPFIETMVQNGYSIDDMKDIDFLEKNAGEKTKKIISEWKTKADGKAFEGGKKYIIKGEKILPLSNDKGELTAAGIDISKINTVDPKAGAEQLRKQLPAGFDKAKFGDFVNNLLKSDIKLFKGLGEILKIFGALLGIDFGEKSEAGKEKLSGKQKRELLDKMGKKNDDYDVTSFFDVTGNPLDKKDDPGFQKYLGDIDKILGPGYLKKSHDGKLFIFDKAIPDGAHMLQVTYKVQPKTAKFDAPSIKKLLDNMDAEGRVIEAGQAQPNLAPAATVAPDKGSEAPKHQYAKLYEGLKDKTSYEAIKNDPQARKLIQEAVGGVKEETYGPNTKAAVKEFQVRELGMQKNSSKIENFADGFFGPKTIALLKAKIDKETPPKK